MNAYRPKGHKTYRVRVPTPTGSVKRYTGTRDKATAKLYDVMLLELGPRGDRRWDLIGPVVEGRISLADLFDAWRSKDLDGLKARLNDFDLKDLLDPWQQWLRDQRKVDAAERYRANLATLLPDGPWWRSTLTKATISKWLGGLSVSPGTKRKYAAALASFIAYANEREVLDGNPMLGVVLPAAVDPDADHHDAPEVQRIVAGTAEPMATLFALLYGTGVEIGAALALRRRDVDLGTWMIRAPGTKNHNRDRTVILAEWARPRVAELCKHLLPDALLFPGLDRWDATKTHKATLKALGIRHLKMHAARNHWAVRALRGGWSVEAVRRQLGHRDGQMVLRRYGKYVSDAPELARLERRAEVESQRRVREG